MKKKKYDAPEFNLTKLDVNLTKLDVTNIITASAEYVIDDHWGEGEVPED